MIVGGMQRTQYSQERWAGRQGPTEVTGLGEQHLGACVFHGVEARYEHRGIAAFVSHRELEFRLLPDPAIDIGDPFALSACTGNVVDSGCRSAL